MNQGREAMVGLTIVAAVVVTVLGTLWLQGISWGQPQRELEAVFSEVGLIKPGNSLKLRGVQVGTVREILVDPDGEVVRVHFRINEGIALPPDPVVILSPESLFGDWQAEIHPRARYPYAYYAEPREPGVLPGHALPDISQLTHMADRISQDLAILTERVGIAFSEETARNIASLIDNVEGVTQRLSEMVSQQAVSFTEVTDGVQRAAVGIGEAAEQAREAFAAAERVLEREELSAILTDLASVSADLREFAAELPETNQAVRNLATRMDSTVARVELIAERAATGEGSVGRLLQDPAMAEELEGMVTELRELLADIRENPRRYVRLSIF
jgi:phospholipid/cholesterol/gamma-HCH transport system substrate-binding protein